MRLDYIFTLLDVRPKGIFRYVVAVLLIITAFTLRMWIWPIDAGLQYVTFFPAVALTAVFAGFWPGMFTTVLSVLLAAYFFFFPYYSFLSLLDSDNILSNLVFTSDGFVVSFFIESMHRFRRKYIHEFEKAHASHIESERNRQQIEGIISNVLDGIITIDEQGIIISSNKSAAQIFGYTTDEINGNNVSMLMPEPESSKHNDYIRRYLVTGKKKIVGCSREVIGLRKDGSTFPMELSVSEVTGVNRIFTGIMRDISERRAHEERMRHLAHHDLLTGLPNRTLLLDRLHQLLIEAKRNDSKVAVMFIDLDNFKPINDTMGHDVGDMLLQEITRELLECLRESDTAARIGGDEFIVLLPSIETDENAMLVAEKICHNLNKSFTLSGQTVSISSSIGVALYPDHSDEEQQLLKQADTAMYHAKKDGRNNVKYYQPHMVEIDAFSTD